MFFTYYIKMDKTTNKLILQKKNILKKCHKKIVKYLEKNHMYKKSPSRILPNSCYYYKQTTTLPQTWMKKKWKKKHVNITSNSTKKEKTSIMKLLAKSIWKTREKIIILRLLLKKIQLKQKTKIETTKQKIREKAQTAEKKRKKITAVRAV
jgi:hypothetical protein